MQRLAGIDKRLAAVRARKARHRARQPSRPVAPITFPPDAHYTRVGGRCAAVDHVGRRVSCQQFDARRRGDAATREAAMAAFAKSWRRELALRSGSPLSGANQKTFGPSEP